MTPSQPQTGAFRPDPGYVYAYEYSIIDTVNSCHHKEIGIFRHHYLLLPTIYSGIIIINDKYFCIFLSFGLKFCSKFLLQISALFVPFCRVTSRHICLFSTQVRTIPQMLMTNTFMPWIFWPIFNSLLYIFTQSTIPNFTNCRNNKIITVDLCAVRFA